LTNLESTILSLGLKFIPNPNVTQAQLISRLENTIRSLQRTLMLKIHFHNQATNKPPYPAIENNPNPWIPPFNPHIHPDIEIFINNSKNKAITALSKSRLIYTSSDSLIHQTLHSLATDPTIIIKPADKNQGLVLLNTNDYITMCMTHLNDPAIYSIIDKTFNPQLFFKPYFAKLKLILISFGKYYTPQTLRNKNNKEITNLAKALLQLESSTNLRVAPVYCLPKVHKSLHAPIPGRLLCSSPSTLTYHCSLYLDKKLQPLLRTLTTICHSSRQVIHELSTLQCPPNSILFCADVAQLYPSIPIPEGIQSVREVCIEHNFLLDELDFLISLLHWVLTHNFCMFNNKIYHQRQGTAMGTPVAVTFANIFLYHLEMPILKNIKNIYNLEPYYRRYIDDIFSTMPKHIAEYFVTEFQSKYPTIKLDAITMTSEGVHQDIKCSLQHTPTCTYVTHTLYQKPTNCYQYIPFLSAHRQHILRNFVFQELKRYRLYCTDNQDFITTSLLFAQRLRERGYPTTIYTNALTKLPSRTKLLTDLRQSFTETTNSQKINNNKLIATINFPTLHPNPNWKTIFSVTPNLSNNPIFQKVYSNTETIIGYKSPPNIASILLRSTFKENVGN
jgi:hypothetical protein